MNASCSQPCAKIFLNEPAKFPTPSLPPANPRAFLRASPLPRFPLFLFLFPRDFSLTRLSRTDAVPPLPITPEIEDYKSRGGEEEEEDEKEEKISRYEASRGLPASAAPAYRHVPTSKPNRVTRLTVHRLVYTEVPVHSYDYQTVVKS